MGNGAKAQQKRERNKKSAGAAAKSQLKQNEMAKNVMCNICRNTFLCTVKEKELEIHSMNKHQKSSKECFPGFVEITKKTK